MQRAFFLVLFVASLAVASLAAASTGARPAVAVPAIQEAPVPATEGRAAFLFGYRPRGSLQSFEAGYRQHLEWHRAAGDPLAWYGWSVTTGDRVGTFIDGTFGVPPAAFDRRVDPPGDRADFARTTAPHAEPVFRTLYRLRPGLSTATPLERRQPPAAFQVLRGVLRSGTRGDFMDEMSRVREQLAGVGDPPRYAVYELIDGGPTPAFLVLIARPSWSDYGGETHSLEGLLRAAHGGEPPATALRAVRDSVLEVRSETWTYRPDLTYLPDRAGGEGAGGPRRQP